MGLNVRFWYRGCPVLLHAWVNRNLDFIGVNDNGPLTTTTALLSAGHLKNVQPVTVADVSYKS